MNTKGHGAGPGQVPIAIIGMDCAFPGAANLNEFWRMLTHGEDGITEVPSTHWSAADYFDPDPKRPDHTYCTRGGFLSPVAFDPTEFGIPPTLLEATDTAQLLSLHIAKRALEDAGYGGEREFNRERVSVIMGITGTQELVIPLAARLGHPLWRKALGEAGVPSDVAESVIQRIADRYVSWQENSFPGLLGNVVAGRIANRLNLRGTNCVIDAACASSLGAVHLAMMELASGRCDMAMTGGADTLNDIFMYMCFSKTPALSPTGDARPFSSDADGTVLGEGIGILVLKRLEDAQRDGDRIYAVIRSIGTSSDGRSQSIYAPHAAGQARCLRNAYHLAGIEADTITLVEAHGTGTKVGDATEFEALKTVFREARSDGSWCAIGSVKSQVGHTKAAAGAAGLIKTALSIYHRALPPTIKIREPNPKLEINESPFYLSTELRPWLTGPDDPRRAGVSSFGFGGSNFHVVMEEHCSLQREPAWDGSVQLIAMSAATVGGLLDQVDTWIARLADSHTSGELLAYHAMVSRQQFDHAHNHRLVLVIERGDDILRILRQSKDRLLQGGQDAAWNTPGAYYGSGQPDGKLAFAFPGQGSQYVGMGRRLACTFPELQDVLAAADRGCDEPDRRVSEAVFPVPAFGADSRSAQESRLTRTELAQPAIGAISAGMARILSRFGIAPDAVCGHSYGELVALCVGGFYDEATLHRLTRLRGRLMAGDGEDRGAMLAVRAPLSDLDALIAEAQLDVVVANRNAPTQGVLSGSRDAINEAMRVCERRGLAARQLPVSGAFHSRLMEGAVAPFRNAVEAANIVPGGLPVYANATASPYPRDSAGVKALLARQLISPVNFVGQICNMYDAGVRTFVEVGPRAVLTGLVGSILADRPHAAVAIDSSSGRRSGVADLARLLAGLAAAGRPVILSQWERQLPEPRKPRMIVPLVGANYRADDSDASRSREATSHPLLETSKAAASAPRASSTRQTTPQQVHENPDMDDKPMNTGAGARPADVSYTSPPDVSIRASQNQATPTVPSPAWTGGTADLQEPQSPAQTSALAEALRLIQDGMRSMQALQQQTSAAHQRFLETQEHAHRAMQQLLENQQRLVSHSIGGGDVGDGLTRISLAPPPHGHAKSQSNRVPESHGSPAGHDPAPARKPVAPPATMSHAAMPPELPVSKFNASPTLRAVNPQTNPLPPNSGQLEPTVLAVVCEKTGYPREMISLEMDIEADLGIDSIKRVEIVAAIEERIPGLPSVKPEHMGALRTLQQIVDYLRSDSGVSTHPGQASSLKPAMVSPAPAQPAASASGSEGRLLDAENFSAAMLDVVAQLTGYPLEMLNLDMDMEADLGIDSIKRVEILAGVEARTPNLPPVKPELMGSLRTLRQIVEYYTAQSPGAADVSRTKEVAAAAASFRDEPTSLTAPSVAIPASQAAGVADMSLRRPATGGVSRAVVEIKPLPKCIAGQLQLPTGGEVWITDDGAGLAAALADELLNAGIRTRVVFLAAIPGHNREPRPCGLILIAPLVRSEGVGVSDEGRALLADSLAAARSLAGSLVASANAGGAILATIARMDGGFGLIGDGFDPAQGGLAGLVKTAALEWPGVRCKAIDVAPDWVDARSTAAAIFRELTVDGPVEVGLSQDRRIGIEATARAVSTTPARSAPGDVIVITGGARGVTAEAALALARRHRPTLVLLGRSPLPDEEPAWLATLQHEAEIKQAVLKHEFAGQRPTPAQLQAAFASRMAGREIRRNLERISAAAAAVIYEAVDVRDADAVRESLQRVRDRYGPIRGLIHGAGVLEDRLIKDKTTEQFAKVFDTKVLGLCHLLAAIDLGELRSLMLFSSVSARYGNTGQADYAMANEVLNKMAQRLSRGLPNCRIASINWGPWDGGMVTPALKREFARMGIELVPIDAGAEALVDEMLANPAAVEVVIGAPIRGGVRGEPQGSSPVVQSSAKPMAVAFEHTLDLERHAFLRSHTIGGRPVLPLAVTMEWLAHGALHANPGMVLQGMESVRVLKALAMDGAATPIQVTVGKPRRDNGTFAVDAELRSHGGSTLHAHACVMLGSRLPPAPDAPDGHDLIDQAYPRSIEEAYEEVLFHGPHFQCITEVCGMSRRGMTARVRSAPPPREWMADPLRGSWIADPLIIDAAFQLTILWCSEFMGAVSLPAFIARYRQYTPAFPRDGAICTLHAREAARATLTADIAFVGTDGRLLAEMSGFEAIVDSSLASAFQRRGAGSIAR